MPGAPNIGRSRARAVRYGSSNLDHFRPHRRHRRVKCVNDTIAGPLSAGGGPFTAVITMRPRNTIPPCGFTSRMRSRSGLPHPGQISADRSWRLGVIDAPLETRCVGTETWRVLPVSRAGLTCGGGSRREGLGTPPGTRVTTVHAPQVLNVPSRPSSIMMGSPQRGHKYLIIARCLPTASLARRNQLVSLRTPLLCRQPNQTKQACVRRHRCSALHPHRHRKVALRHRQQSGSPSPHDRWSRPPPSPPDRAIREDRRQSPTQPALAGAATVVRSVTVPGLL